MIVGIVLGLLLGIKYSRIVAQASSPAGSPDVPSSILAARRRHNPQPGRLRYGLPIYPIRFSTRYTSVQVFR